MTRPASSTTGNALIRRLRSMSAISLNDALFRTATTEVVMMSLTVALMAITSRVWSSGCRRGVRTGMAESHQSLASSL